MIGLGSLLRHTAVGRTSGAGRNGPATVRSSLSKNICTSKWQESAPELIAPQQENISVCMFPNSPLERREIACVIETV